jgi:glycosyltransferase involved in cell wall biosynthesis
MLELVDHGRNGLLVPPGDEHALAMSLRDLLQNDRMAAEFGTAARITIESRYSFDRMVSAFTNLYFSELTSRAGFERALLAS